jgi:hypothetical protein
VPPPDRPLTAEALEIYQREYRSQLADRIRPLVRHAIRYWELTLLMVERTGIETVERAWVERTRADLERARQLLLGPTEASPPTAPGEPQPASALGSPVSTRSAPSEVTATQ